MSRLPRFTCPAVPEVNDFTGSVYFQEKDPPGERDQIDHLFRGSQLGRYVDGDGDTMVVGSYGFQGSVYVYCRTKGVRPNETKLAPYRSMNKDFGETVKVGGNRIAGR